jgi:ComF family protein
MSNARAFAPLAPRCVCCGIARGDALCEECVDDYMPPAWPRCVRCAARLPAFDGASTCGVCLAEPPHFDAAVALGDYAPPLDAMILALKGRAQLHLAQAFGAELARRLRGTAHWHAAVPLPLAFEQLRARGFNQSLELARPVARALGIALTADALLRTRDTGPQHLLAREERRRNVQGAFGVPTAARSRIAGADLLLIDDVMTSGATLDAASGALKAAGAARVTVAVVARTP